MGRYDGQIDPPLPEIAECPECEQMHRYYQACPETPLAETVIRGVRILAVGPYAWDGGGLMLEGGSWDCYLGSYSDREETMAAYDKAVEWVSQGRCRGADDEPDCSHCPYRP